MPGYAPIHPIVGIQALNEMMTPDTTQRWPAGMVVDAVDAYFGFGRFMYLQAGAAYDPGTLVTVVDQTFLTAVLAVTANLGTPYYVCRQVMSAVNTWGWFQFEGVAPLRVDVGVAAGAAIGIGTTAGRATTNAAGKQLLGTRVLQPVTFTLTKTGQTQAGSAVINLTNVDGLFKGLAMTGTGVGAASVISTINPNLSVLGTVVSTATGQATITFTYTGFVLAAIQNPHTQGAIT